MPRIADDFAAIKAGLDTLDSSIPKSDDAEVEKSALEDPWAPFRAAFRPLPTNHDRSLEEYCRADAEASREIGVAAHATMAGELASVVPRGGAMSVRDALERRADYYRCFPKHVTLNPSAADDVDDPTTRALKAGVDPAIRRITANRRPRPTSRFRKPSHMDDECPDTGIRRRDVSRVLQMVTHEVGGKHSRDVIECKGGARMLAKVNEGRFLDMLNYAAEKLGEDPLDLLGRVVR